jgi:hypothetical protein
MMKDDDTVVNFKPATTTTTKARKRTAKPRGDNGAAIADDERQRLLVEMNNKYCVVQDGGKVDVLMFERVAQNLGNFQHVRFVPMFLSFANFRNKYLNRTLSITGKDSETRAVALGNWWLKHPERRQYDGLTFQPSGDAVINDHLNLWRGWGIEPRAGDWSLMREHIRVVLAANDPAACDYIMNWLAFAVQHPDQRAEVALVFKGKRGTGRGTLGNALIRIFGQPVGCQPPHGSFQCPPTQRLFVVC